MFGGDHIGCGDPLARTIEFDLKRRVWAAENIDDDHIVWPVVFVGAALARAFDWGVPLRWRDSGVELGARKIIAPFADGIDVDRVDFRDMEVDEEKTAALAAKARELTAGRLEVKIHYPNLGHSPLEVAVEMRGMEGLLLDCADAPGKVEALMEKITCAYISHHERREREGWLNVHPAEGGRYSIVTTFRIHCWRGSGDTGNFAPALADEWAYVSAQSAAGLGPAMFDRFVHRYNRRLAEYFTKKTVYYHGCEKLDHKLDVLATLPNLRRFHVSPWSSVQAARDKFDGKVVLEVHCHPGKVFFGFSPHDMRAEISGLIDAAKGAPLDLNLSDINSVNGDPTLLTTWSQVAREESLGR